MHIVVFEEKHGNQSYDISTPEKRQQAFESVLKERIEYGWYSDEHEAQLALDNGKAEQFLTKHKRGEYEGFHFATVQSL